MGKNLVDMIHIWTNAKSMYIYKGDWEGQILYRNKKFIGMINPIYIYKLKMKIF